MTDLKQIHSSWLAVLLVGIFCLASGLAAQTKPESPRSAVTSMGIAAQNTVSPHPSILFCSPQGAAYGWIDVKYLNHLHDDGFEVDYTESLLDLLPKQKAADGTLHAKIDLNRYNTVVLYATPETAIDWMGYNPFAQDGGDNQAFLTLIRDYVDKGGGVFLFPREMNMHKQTLYDLAHPWGINLPMETIEHPSDSPNLSVLHHATQPVPIAYTDNINRSDKLAEIVKGVNGVWYPVGPPGPEWLAGASGPLAPLAGWTVVVSAALDAKTQPIDYSLYKVLAVNVPVQPGTAPRASPVSAPALMAVRASLSGDGQAGPARAAMLNQWPQYTLGSGLGWIFDSQVLSTGSGNRPSDMGKLLENTFRWLSQPSLKTGTVGGYVTVASKLQPPNAAQEIKDQFVFNASWESLQKQWSQPPAFAPAYRGLIGAQTIYSGGASTVAQYAAAARVASIQFVVFLEDFNNLSAADFASLKRDCLASSGSDLLLVPGFRVQANICDHMFFIGPAAEFLSDEVVIQANGKKCYNLQPPDPADSNKYTGYNGNGFWWLYRYMNTAANIGFYNFSVSSQLIAPGSFQSTLRISDLRDCGLVGLCYYKNNKVVEDFSTNSNLVEYRTCAQCTLPPVPISVNIVASVAEFNRELSAGHALTYVHASSVSKIFAEGLGYAGTQCRTFVSDGPMIHEWQGEARAMTYGSEEFVTPAAIMPTRIEVSSSTDLDRADIYNGRDLFRSIALTSPAGSPVTQWWAELMLNSSVQKNLVLELTDSANHKAVSYARQCWKDGGREIRFCSDRLNDCHTGLLAHGSAGMLVNFVPALSDDAAGYTWDGGPLGDVPLVSLESRRLSIESSQGHEDAVTLNQTPLLEFSDEGAVAVTSENNRKFDARVENVTNGGDTWGPLAGAPNLFSPILRYREFVLPTIGVRGTYWAGYAERSGIACSLFRCEIELKQSMSVSELRLMYSFNKPAPSGTYFAYGHLANGQPTTTGTLQIPRDVAPNGNLKIDLSPGDWFAFFSPDATDNHIFIVRSEPVHFFLAHLYDTVKKASTMFSRITGELSGESSTGTASVVAGEKHVWELFSLGVPMNLSVRDVTGIQKMLTYLSSPGGLVIKHGLPVASPGLLELAPANGYVEVSVNQPAINNNLTLPLRVSGLNRRWTAGLLQKAGYVKGFYGSGENRYREVGLDTYGYAYIPLYPNLAPLTQVIVGHPVTASGTNADQIFIQVTHLYDNPAHWHISVNNPTDRAITATLHNAFALPGLSFADTKITLRPGEYRVLLAP